jgi:hypothetical protein
MWFQPAFSGLQAADKRSSARMYGGLRVYACAAISLPPWQSNTEDRFCLVELLHFHKNRCEIPLHSNAFDPDLMF